MSQVEATSQAEPSSHVQASSQVELFDVQPRITIDDYAGEAAFAARHRQLAARVDATRGREPTDSRPG